MIAFLAFFYYLKHKLNLLCLFLFSILRGTRILQDNLFLYSDSKLSISKKCQNLFGKYKILVTSTKVTKTH